MTVLFTSALAAESARLARRAPVLHTGAGKVQAATALGQHLAEHPEVDLVVNLGTAGALNPALAVGTVAEVAVVLQHDFDVEALSALAGVPLPGGPIPLTDAAAGTRLATGDRFVSDPTERRALAAVADLVDMEGYAVAATCRAFGVPVRLVKCVSDSADAHAPLSWRDTIDLAATQLAEWASDAGLLA